MPNQPFIDFSDSLYDDTVYGLNYYRGCTKKWMPTSFEMTRDVIDAGDIVAVKIDFLPQFFKINFRVRSPVTLVVTDGDYAYTQELGAMKPAGVTKVFATHNTCVADHSIAMPIGLGPPFGRGAPLADDIKVVNTRQDRDYLLYVNFRTNTFPSEREPLMAHFRENCSSWATIENQDTDYNVFAPYLNSLIRHKFCLCPRGNGVESHRMWEALYCRTIPVVRREICHRNYGGLPILFINNWSEVTEDFLNAKYEEMRTQTWDYSKLSASWWHRQFRGV